MNIGGEDIGGVKAKGHELIWCKGGPVVIKNWVNNYAIYFLMRKKSIDCTSDVCKRYER